MTTVQVLPQRLLLSGWLLTNVQVNITTALHDTGHTCIYITLALLFMFFFTLLPFFWAGWLSSIPFDRYSYVITSLILITIWSYNFFVKIFTIFKKIYVIKFLNHLLLSFWVIVFVLFCFLLSYPPPFFVFPGTLWNVCPE